MAVPTTLPNTPPPASPSPQRFYFYFGKCKKTRLSHGGWKFTEGPRWAEYSVLGINLLDKKDERGALPTHTLSKISQA